MTSFHIIIPARYASTRLPGKPLRELAGRPLVGHVIDRALASEAKSVTVATDDDRIARACRELGARVCMTSADHASGTDRLAECARELGLEDDAIVVNLQGDEPLTPPDALARVASGLAEHPDAAIATLCRPIQEASELHDPNAVKLVLDEAGYALYFSRAPIPWHREGFARQSDSLPEGVRYLRHIGLYAYRMAFLKRYAELAAPECEAAEQLEQLRALHHGHRIFVDLYDRSLPAGVDSEEDLRRVERILQEDSST